MNSGSFPQITQQESDDDDGASKSNAFPPTPILPKFPLPHIPHNVRATAVESASTLDSSQQYNEGIFTARRPLTSMSSSGEAEGQPLQKEQQEKQYCSLGVVLNDIKDGDGDNNRVPSPTLSAHATDGSSYKASASSCSGSVDERAARDRDRVNLFLRNIGDWADACCNESVEQNHDMSVFSQEFAASPTPSELPTPTSDSDHPNPPSKANEMLSSSLGVDSKETHVQDNEFANKTAAQKHYGVHDAHAHCEGSSPQGDSDLDHDCDRDCDRDHEHHRGDGGGGGSNDASDASVSDNGGDDDDDNDDNDDDGDRNGSRRQFNKHHEYSKDYDSEDTGPVFRGHDKGADMPLLHSTNAPPVPTNAFADALFVILCGIVQLATWLLIWLIVRLCLGFIIIWFTLAITMAILGFVGRLLLIPNAVSMGNSASSTLALLFALFFLSIRIQHPL